MDLVNWFSVISLLFLMLATTRYSIGRLFAWILLLAAMFWLLNLHREIDATVASWRKKHAEMKARGTPEKFLLFLRMSELELWGYWTMLLFTDWFGVFWGTIALGLEGLGKVWVVPFFIVSLSGMITSVVYLGMYFYRVWALKRLYNEIAQKVLSK